VICECKRLRVSFLALIWVGGFGMVFGRDEFSAKVKRLLGDRVAWKCSYPNCGQITIGPDLNNPGKKINNGVAAHICAAAKGGPRYKLEMSPEQRASYDNGIWMCRNHGNLIDAVDSSHPEETLREWKKDAESRALEALKYPAPAGDLASLRELNVLRHREMYPQSFDDLGCFHLYSSDGAFLLSNGNVADILIERASVRIKFNTYYNGNLRRRGHNSIEFDYIKNVELDFFLVVDELVKDLDFDETMHGFSIDYDVGEFINIDVETHSVYYSGSYCIRNREIYDDLERRLLPYRENVILNMVDVLNGLRNRYFDRC
jgi:hypothetical protein